MCSVVFDIETGPLSLEALQSVCDPFDASTFRHPGEFDPSTVKCGNIGGPESDKGKAKIEAARLEHEKAVANYADLLRKAEESYWLNIQDKAALSALTGEVLAIGYSGKAVKLETRKSANDEPELLQSFWSMFTKCREQKRKLVGFYIKDFDVPFLIQRSFVLGVDVPEGVFNGRYLSDTFVDLYEVWQAGSRNARGNLDGICRACGIGSKPTGMDGSQFARLFHNIETRPTALAYLENDLSMARNFASRIGKF